MAHMMLTSPLHLQIANSSDGERRTWRNFRGSGVSIPYATPPRARRDQAGLACFVACTAFATRDLRHKRCQRCWVHRRNCIELRAGPGGASADQCAGADPLRRDLEAFLAAQRKNPPISDPLGGPLTSYSDNPFDLALIAVFRFVMSGVAKWQSPLPFWGPEAYEGMLETAHAQQWKKTLQETEDSSMAVIDGLIPESGKEMFRNALKPDKFGTELNAGITAAFFPFVVGNCEIETRTRGDVPCIPEGEAWNCAVKIEKCRWLEQSGCVGMCAGLCKRPMQRMFGDVLGMPLSMEPNMEDLSCKMVFGKDPDPWDEDDLRKQTCFPTCATARKGDGACHKLT